MNSLSYMPLSSHSNRQKCENHPNLTGDRSQAPPYLAVFAPTTPLCSPQPILFLLWPCCSSQRLRIIVAGATVKAAPAACSQQSHWNRKTTSRFRDDKPSTLPLTIHPNAAFTSRGSCLKCGARYQLCAALMERLTCHSRKESQWLTNNRIVSSVTSGVLATATINKPWE